MGTLGFPLSEGQSGPQKVLEGGGKSVSFVVRPWLLFVFSPPRFLYLEKRPDVCTVRKLETRRLTSPSSSFPPRESKPLMRKPRGDPLHTRRNCVFRDGVSPALIFFWWRSLSLPICDFLSGRRNSQKLNGWIQKMPLNLEADT